MKKIVDVILWIYNFFVTIYDSVLGVVSHLADFVNLLTKAYNFVTTLISYIPQEIQIFAIMTIFVALLYQILHREQGA